MPQSKRQTDDVGERLKFKSRMKDKLSEALSPPASPKNEPTVFHLPSDYEKLSEPELMYTLVHNPELQHSNESAALAVNMLYGRASASNIQFELVDLPNPVEVPEFIDLRPATRKPSKTAPGFARSVDSLPERMAKEVVKKQQFKQALADKIKQKIEAKPVVTKKKVKVLQLPANYTELSEADLHYTLVNSPQLKHSHESALLAIDMIKGKAVRDATLQVTDFIAQKTLPKIENKRVSKPKKVTPKDVTTVVKEAEKVYLLPPNYLELPESKLGLELAHNPEYKYTPEEAYYILDILFNRISEPEGVAFAVYEPTPPENAQSPKLPEPSAALELKVPANYRDFSSVDLHTILLNTPELEHTEETATLAVKIVAGGERPTNVVLHTVNVDLALPEVEKEEEFTAPDSWIKVNLESLSEGENVVTLPRGYNEMTEQQLVFNLMHKIPKELALDIVDALKGKRRLNIRLSVEEGPFPDPDPLPLPDPVPPFPDPDPHPEPIEPFPEPEPEPQPEPVPRIDE